MFEPVVINFCFCFLLPAFAVFIAIGVLSMLFDPYKTVKDIKLAITLVVVLLSIACISFAAGQDVIRRTKKVNNSAISAIHDAP